MHPFLVRLACLVPPIKKLRARSLEQGGVIAELEAKLESVSRQLERIDASFRLSKTRTPALTPREGENGRVYYVEALSQCNLRCGLCAHGNASLFQRAPGRMSLELFERILDKIKAESPSAMVNPYHNCEPALHPQLPEMMRAIRRRGFDTIPSFNWNHVDRLDELLLSGLDKMEISISGFSPEIYARSHRQGKIEHVKKNLLALREAIDRLKLSVWVRVDYHMYKDNLGEDFDEAKRFVEELGFVFFANWARNISTEMTLLYLRAKGLGRYIPPCGQSSWFSSFPSLPLEVMAQMERIIYLPEDYLQGEWQYITPLTCNLNRAQVNIRWDGKVNLCAWAFDDRLALGDFLDTTPDEIAATRHVHPVCLECRANNVIFYLQYADMDNINKIALARLGRDLNGQRSF